MSTQSLTSPRRSAPVAAMAQRPGRSGPLLRPLVKVAAALLLALGVLFVGRHVLDSLLARMDYAAPVHRDGTVLDAGVRPQIRPQTQLVYRDEDGQRVRVLVDEARFSAFVRDKVRELEARRLSLSRRAGAIAAEAAAPVFASMQARVQDFGDWYFAWGTGYRLLGKTASALVRHGATPGLMDLDDAVAHEVEQYVARHYRELVLRPEISEPALREAYAAALETVHEELLDALAALDADLQRFVAANSSYLDGTAALASVRVSLDWEARVQKLSLAGWDRPVPEPAAAAALVGSGALAGRAAGAAAGRALASSLAARSVAPKLAAPLSSRVLTAMAGASAGAAGGPLGLALGGAAGLGLDYLLNEATALAVRDSLEADVREAVHAQARHWQGLMAGSLRQASDVWHNDLIQLVAAYGSR